MTAGADAVESVDDTASAAVRCRDLGRVRARKARAQTKPPEVLDTAQPCPRIGGCGAIIDAGAVGAAVFGRGPRVEHHAGIV